MQEVLFMEQEIARSSVSEHSFAPQCATTLACHLSASSHHLLKHQAEICILQAHIVWYALDSSSGGRHVLQHSPDIFVLPQRCSIWGFVGFFSFLSRINSCRCASRCVCRPGPAWCTLGAPPLSHVHRIEEFDVVDQVTYVWCSANTRHTATSFSQFGHTTVPWLKR